MWSCVRNSLSSKKFFFASCVTQFLFYSVLTPTLRRKFLGHFRALKITLELILGIIFWANKERFMNNTTHMALKLLKQSTCFLVLMHTTTIGKKSVQTIFGFSASLLSVLRGLTLHIHLGSNVCLATELPATLSFKGKPVSY